jgi:hypothetical protein
LEKKLSAIGFFAIVFSTPPVDSLRSWMIRHRALCLFNAPGQNIKWQATSKPANRFAQRNVLALGDPGSGDTHNHNTATR